MAGDLSSRSRGSSVLVRGVPLHDAHSDGRGGVGDGAGSRGHEDGGVVAVRAHVLHGVKVLRHHHHLHDILRVDVADVLLEVHHGLAQAVDDGLALARDACTRQKLRLASASAAFTTMIFSASALSCAATRRRCAALISFMAIFTFWSGAMSVTSVWMMAYPNSVIAFSSMDFTSIAISSLVVNTSSRLIRGTVDRTTSKMYDRPM